MSPRRTLLLALALLPGLAGCFSIKLPEKIVVNPGGKRGSPNSAAETAPPCELGEQSAPAPGERPALAVLDFQFGEDMPADVGRALADLCRAAIGDSNYFVLVDRARIADILGERDFADAMKCDTTVCIVRYGKLLGAEKMMHGRINRLGNLYVLGVAMTDVATGQQISRSASLASVEDSTDAIPELVCRIIRDLSTERE